jgi:hypothetical protein
MERRSHGRILATVLTMVASAGLPLAVVTLGTAATTASAQMLRVTPWQAVVNVDEAILRCGSGDLMYPVATLRRGQVLRVDGEGQGWARVSYPAGTAAFIGADAVQVDAATRTATLMKPSRLKAFNQSTGLRGSWKDVFDEPLPAGTRLTVIDAEPMADGRGNTAWRIAPPDNAPAFIPLSSLRRATEEEVQLAAIAARMPSSSPAVSPAAPVAQAPQNTSPANPQPTTTVERWPVGTAPGSGANLAEPMAPPAQNALGSLATAEAPAAPRTLVLPPSPYESLEAAFEGVRTESADNAEFSELLAEFQKAFAQLDESPGSQAIRGRLQQRIEYLKLRADLQARKQQIAASEAALSADDVVLAERLAEVDRTRQYTIVGRLSASTIYNGERLPLMYRIQSVGGSSSRTLAYVRPSEVLNIDSRLGQIVGVLGESTLDPSLRLTVINPVRVDALEASATAVVEPDKQ